MPSASWLNGWLTGDVVTTAEFSKGSGAFFDSTLGSAGASFDITSVPTWGSHIRIVIQARGTNASTSTGLLMRLNNDSAGNYDYELISANASTAAASETFAATSLAIGDITAASAAAGIASSAFVDIPNFRGSTFQKSVNAKSSLKTGTATGNLFAREVAGFWRSTAAITRVTFLPTAGNFDVGSRCTAYVLGP